MAPRAGRPLMPTCQCSIGIVIYHHWNSLRCPQFHLAFTALGKRLMEVTVVSCLLPELTAASGLQPLRAVFMLLLETFCCSHITPGWERTTLVPPGLICSFSAPVPSCGTGNLMTLSLATYLEHLEKNRKFLFLSQHA